MKFFIPLGFKYGDHWLTGSVYGPYENDNAVEKALAGLWPNNKKERFLVFDGQIVNVKPSSLERHEHEKREPGNMNNYVKDGDGWKCKDCNAIIISARVAHPVHFHGMHGAGGGECKYETVPYCPNCEKQPNFNGAPVYE